MSNHIRKREGDPEWSDRWQERADPMELRVGWGHKSIQAKGLTVVVVLVLGAAVASNLYAGWRLEAAFAKSVEVANKIAEKSTTEHRAIKKAQDRMSCMMAIPAEARNAFRSTYQVGSFERWCPWVTEE